MDWADDVAYSVHDLEDGVLAGLVRLEDLHDPAERDELALLAAQVYSGESAADLAYGARRPAGPALLAGDVRRRRLPRPRRSRTSRAS